jgi:hypothetical protein
VSACLSCGELVATDYAADVADGRARVVHAADGAHWVDGPYFAAVIL